MNKFLEMSTGLLVAALLFTGCDSKDSEDSTTTSSTSTSGTTSSTSTGDTTSSTSTGDTGTGGGGGDIGGGGSGGGGGADQLTCPEDTPSPPFVTTGFADESGIVAGSATVTTVSATGMTLVQEGTELSFGWHGPALPFQVGDIVEVDYQWMQDYIDNVVYKGTVSTVIGSRGKAFGIVDHNFGLSSDPITPPNTDIRFHAVPNCPRLDSSPPCGASPKEVMVYSLLATSGADTETIAPLSTTNVGAFEITNAGMVQIPGYDASCTMEGNYLLALTVLAPP